MRLFMLLGGDPNVAKPSQILRVPGSVNPKASYGRKPTTSNLWFLNGPVINVEQLEEALDRAEDEPGREIQLGAPVSDLDHDPRCARLTDRAKRIIIEGYIADEAPKHQKDPSRRGAWLWDACWEMAEAGMQPPDMLAILRDQRYGLAKKAKKKHGGIENAANAAYRIIQERAAKALEPSPRNVEPASQEQGPPRQFIDITDCDEAKLPRRDMLVEDIFERGKLSVTAGQGGTVKSTLALYIGLAVASGREAGPFKPTNPYNVGYVGVEDDVTEQRRRMFALLHLDDLRGVKLPQQGNLFEGGGSFHTLECDVVTLAKRNEDSGDIEPTDTYSWLCREVERLKLDLLIIDPLVEITEGVNENDNSHMQKVMALLRMMARRLNIHVNVVHHFNKPGEANNPGAVRGGSAIINAARLNINLEKANDTDCKTYGIGEADRYCRIKMVIPKANNTPTGAINWFAIDEVHLKNGDFVAGISAWNPADDLEPVTPAVISTFLDALEQGRPNGDRYTASSKGKKDARADQLLIDAGVPKAQARALIRRLLDTGIIRDEEYTNSGRKSKQGLVVLKRPSGDFDIPY
jgi:hypothetical protein